MATRKVYEVLGFKKIDYVRKSDNRQVTGTEVYLSPVDPDKGVQGMQCEAVYLPGANSTYLPTVGDHVVKTYNQWGKVDDLIYIND